MDLTFTPYATAPAYEHYNLLPLKNILTAAVRRSIQLVNSKGDLNLNAIQILSHP